MSMESLVFGLESMRSGKCKTGVTTRHAHMATRSLFCPTGTSKPPGAGDCEQISWKSEAYSFESGGLQGVDREPFCKREATKGA